jgi:hypothetical protein
MIDTYSYFNTLKEAGFDDRQADAMTKGITGFVVGSLATKADVIELRVEMDRRFNSVDERFNVANQGFNAIDTRLVALDLKLASGLQRNFLGVLSVLGGFVALATYVGTHVK